MKIAIIGPPGSGKSTVARIVHMMLHIPLYHLDYYFWQPDWQRPDRDDFQQIHQNICNQKMWIIEGMATRLLEYRILCADIIIFLDIPLYKCLYRIFKRSYNYYGSEREDSAKGCPERFPRFEFLRYIMKFNKQQKPTIQKILERHREKKQVFVIKNNTQLQTLLQKLSS